MKSVNARNKDLWTGILMMAIALLFTGYALVDSASPKPGTDDSHGH